MRIQRLLAMIGCCYASVLWSAPLTFCHDDQEYFPWWIKEGVGLDGQLIQLLEKAMHIPIVLLPLPWQRCTYLLQQGKVDGAMGVSFLPERMQWGFYPMLADGKPDRSKRLRMSGYSLYRLKGSMLNWDGTTLTLGNGPIGIQTGFSVEDLLKKLHAKVNDGSQNPLAILRMLSLKRLSGAALQTSRGDQLLNENPDLAAVIERCKIPLEEKPYYLMLSHQLVQRDPELAQKIWDTLEQQRESHAFQALQKAFLSGK